MLLAEAPVAEGSRQIRTPGKLSVRRQHRIGNANLKSRSWAGYRQEADVAIGGGKTAGLELAVFGKTG